MSMKVQDVTSEATSASATSFDRSLLYAKFIHGSPAIAYDGSMMLPAADGRPESALSIVEQILSYTVATKAFLCIM